MGSFRHLLFGLLLVLLAGCGDSGAADFTAGAVVGEETTSGSPEVVEGSMPEATIGVAARAAAGETSREPVFIAAEEASGGGGFGADGLLAVRHGVHEGYERVVLDLGAGDEPAEGVPEWSLNTPEGDGLLRITLPSVSATAVSNGALGDGFLEGFHVVRAPDEGVFVDILSREAFSYRVIELTDPARLVVDFESAGTRTDLPSPSSGGSTVLVEPRRGERVSNPLIVSGYSRNFEAANEIVLLDSSGEVLARQSVASNDWSATWGHFEATLDLPEFRGEGTLRVGSPSARDASFKGVEIPVYATGQV
ncbi:MAG: Gmad2 immunoglobulin-like domain-containing protein [Rubrobacteraceae bacterium]